MINIRLALEQALSVLDNKNPDTRLEAEILLGWILNKNRAYLFAHPEVQLSQIQWESYQQSLNQRRLGMPLAYITGTREFWSLDLKVNKHTLIPRHETELLVELALELIHKQGAKVLDLGTGSGAIALALAKERPNWQIDAVDMSQEALALAGENAENHALTNICFYQSDWFQHLANKRYDAIISNPPYVDIDNSHGVCLDFEPIKALISGESGLADLGFIINNSMNYLQTNGILLLEHGFDQKSAISTILSRLGYKNIQCWQDFQGHDRVSGGYI